MIQYDRPTPCPFYDLGCIAELVHKDVPDHLDIASHSHLLLALNTIRDQAISIKNLSTRYDRSIRNIIAKHSTKIYVLCY